MAADVDDLPHGQEDALHLAGSPRLGRTAAVHKHPPRPRKQAEKAAQVGVHQLVHHLVAGAGDPVQQAAGRGVGLGQAQTDQGFQFAVPRQPQLLRKADQQRLGDAALPGKGGDGLGPAGFVVGGDVLADIPLVFAHAGVGAVEQGLHRRGTACAGQGFFPRALLEAADEQDIQQQVKGRHHLVGGPPRPLHRLGSDVEVFLAHLGQGVAGPPRDGKGVDLAALDAAHHPQRLRAFPRQRDGHEHVFGAEAPPGRLHFAQIEQVHAALAQQQEDVLELLGNGFLLVAGAVDVDGGGGPQQAAHPAIGELGQLVDHGVVHPHDGAQLHPGGVQLPLVLLEQQAELRVALHAQLFPKAHQSGAGHMEMLGQLGAVHPADLLLFLQDMADQLPLVGGQLVVDGVDPCFQTHKHILPV